MSENYIVINGRRAELTKEQMEQLGIEAKKKIKGGEQMVIQNIGFLILKIG